MDTMDSPIRIEALNNYYSKIVCFNCSYDFLVKSHWLMEMPQLNPFCPFCGKQIVVRSDKVQNAIQLFQELRS